MTKHSLYVLVALIMNVRVAAGQPVELPGTTIQMPWKNFHAMVNKKPDTVYVRPGAACPVAIVLTRLQAGVRLLDSSAQVAFNLGYSVLDTSRWSTLRLFTEEADVSFLSISMPRGDYLCSRDTGFVLVAGAQRPPLGSRSARLALVKNADIDEGARRIEFPMPAASDRSVTVDAPSDFSDITFENATLISQQKNGIMVRYFCALPSNSKGLGIHYAPPIRQKKAVPQPRADTAGRKPMIVAAHETGLFVSDNNAFVVSAVHISVAQAPISRFSITLPGSFSLLKIEGAGIKTWTQGKGGVLDVSLGFECKDQYTLFMIGETPVDSLAQVPSFSVNEAKRQTGRFGIMAAGSSEAEAVAANNCVSMSPAQFVKECTPEFTAKCAENKKNLSAIIFAGESYAVPFIARCKITRHQLVPVVNAMADLGVLRTIIGDDRKMLTMATFAIRQRDRQFLSLSFKDSCALWAVTLDGNAVAPFRDSDGTYKISLQRYIAASNSERPVVLTFTYLSLSDSFGRPMQCRLNAPTLDVPVSRLEWTIFYPEKWRVKKVKGDFTVPKSALFGTPRLTRDAAESRKLLAELRQTVEQQTANGPAVKLFSGPSKTVFAYKILVVNERPWIGLLFGKPVPWAAIFIIVGLVLTVGVAGYFWRKERGKRGVKNGS
jgi:hypothetical protein